MFWFWLTLVVVVILAIVLFSMAVKIVKQYERGVLFRLGRVIGVREPGLRLIIPFVDVLHRVSLRIVTMPIQSQGIITRTTSASTCPRVAYFRVVDAVKSVVAIENVNAAINQIAQTTLRKVVGQHTPGRDPVGDRPDQHRHPRDPRHHHRRMGRRSHPGRAQGHPAAREHEARHGQAGRSRTGEAGEDHQR